MINMSLWFSSILVQLPIQKNQTHLSLKSYKKVIIKQVHFLLTNIERAQFHNTLIRLRFNPIYFMQNYTYFKQFYQECLKQNIQFTYESALTSVVFVRTTH